MYKRQLGDDPLRRCHGRLVAVDLLLLGAFAPVGLGERELLGAPLAELGGLGGEPVRGGPVLVGLPGGEGLELGHLAFGRRAQDGDLPLGAAADLLDFGAGLPLRGLGFAFGVGAGQVVVAAGVLAQLGGLGRRAGADLGHVLLGGGGGLGGLDAGRAHHRLGFGAGLGEHGGGLAPGLVALDGGVLLGGAQDLLDAGAEPGQGGLLGLGDLRGAVGDAALQGRDPLLGAAQLPLGGVEGGLGIGVLLLAGLDVPVEPGGELVDLLAVVTAHADGEFGPGLLEEFRHDLPVDSVTGNG